MKKIMLLLLLMVFVIPLINANPVVYQFYNDTMNDTSSFKKTSGTFTIENQNGVYGANLADASSHAHQDISNFFMNQPFNGTIFSYLGADIFRMNFSARGSSTAGHISTFTPLWTSTTNLIEINFDDTNIDLKIGNTADANVVAHGGNMYNFSVETNFTSGYTNVSIIKWDGVGGYTLRSIKDVFDTTALLDKNFTMFDTGAAQGNIFAALVNMYSNFDADYFRDYTNNIEEGQLFHRQIQVNFSSPIVVNASVLINGVSTTLCDNCQNHQSNLTSSAVSTGYNQLVFNYTFWKNDTQFSKTENKNVFVDVGVAMCGSVAAATNQIFALAFTDELNVNSLLTGNYTIYLNDMSGNRLLTNTTIQTNSLQVCVTPDTASAEYDYQIFYDAGSTTYPLRQLNTNKRTLNHTNPINETAWLLEDATSDNYVITLEETSGTLLGGYVIEALKLSGITNLIQLVNSYETGSTTGQAVHPLDLTTIGAMYNFLVFDAAGNFVEETGYHALTGTSETIRISLDTGQVAGVQKELEEKLNWTFTFDSNVNFTAIWGNATAYITQSCVKVIASDVNTTLNFYQEVCLPVNATDQSGSITITIPNNSTSYTGTYVVTSSKNSLDYLLQTLYADFPKFEPYKIIGLDGVFWVAIMVMTLSLIGIANPFVAVGMGGFAFVLMAYFKILNIPQQAIWVIVAMIGFLWWAMRRE